MTHLRSHQRRHSYLLGKVPGVRNANSTITAFSSNYIKIATRHELMKRPVRTHNLKAVLDVSIGCRIMPMGNLLNRLVIGTFDLARHRMPFSLILIVMMALILTVDGNNPIFHFKREPNISCSRTQFSITTAYGILSKDLSVRCVEHRQRRFCSGSRGHLSTIV